MSDDATGLIGGPKKERSRSVVLPLVVSAVIMLLVPALVFGAHAYKVPEQVDNAGDVGRYASTAVAPNGNAGISYYDADQNSGALKFAMWDGSTWDTETVESGGVGQFTSVSFDATGDPHIAYYSTVSGDLKYATKSGVSWDIQTVDTGVTHDVGQYASLAIDGAGSPHIAYRDATDEDLKYAVWDGATWDIAVIDSVGDVGLYSSLALDSQGRPHVSYNDNTNDDLKYATCTGGDCANPANWAIQTVDPGPGIPYDTSIALGASDDPHISYFRADIQDLKYAHWTGAVWDLQVLDTTADTGRKNSIAINASGDARISYIDSTNFALKIAAWDTASARWVLNFIDIGVSSGENTSLDLDETGDAHIAYFDLSNTALRYIKAERWADVEAPAVELRINLGAQWTNNTSASLGVVCTDQATGCDQMRFSSDDGSTWTDWEGWVASRPWTLATPDGTKTIMAEVKDGMGNVTDDVSSIVLDTTVPAAFGLDTPTDNAWVTASPTLAWLASSDGGTGLWKYMLLIDGADDRDNISPLATSTTPLSSLVEGDHTWQVRALDNAGNSRMSSQLRTIKVDATMPTGAVTAEATSGFVEAQTVTLDVECADTPSGCSQMRFSNNGGVWGSWTGVASSATWDVTAGDGFKTVYAQIRDVAGNTINVQDEVTLDTTAPVATFAIEGGDEYINTDSVSVDVTCTDGGVGCDSMRIGDTADLSGSAWEPVDTPRAWTLQTGDGEKTVYAEFRDVFGRAVPISDTVTIDTVAPTGTVSVSSDVGVVGATSVDLDLTCSDSPAGCDQMRFSNDGAAWSSWENFASTKTGWNIVAGDGTKTVYVQFRDTAQNVSPGLTDDVILDTTQTAPFNPLSPANNSFQVPSPTFVWEDAIDLNGIAEYELWIDGARNVDAIPEGVTSTVSAAPLADGTHSWFVKAIDNGGNVRNSASWNVKVDLTAPLLSLDIAGGADYTNTTTPDLSVSCADGAGSGCDEMRFSNDGVLWSGWENFSATKTGWDLGAGADGARVAYVEVRDVMGNVAQAFDGVVVDSVGPQAFNSTGPADGSWIATGWTTPTFTWEGTTDDLSGLAEYELYVTKAGDSPAVLAKDGVSSADVSAVADFAKRIQLQEAAYEWFIRAKDSAGNYTDTPVRTVGYDATGPTGTVIVNGGSAFTTNLNVTLTTVCSDAGSDCATVTYSSDLVTWTAPVAIADGIPHNKLFTFPNVGDSIQPVYYKMTDQAGNESGVMTAFITLDRKPPVAKPVIRPFLSTDKSATHIFTIYGWKSGAYDPAYGSGIKNYDVWWRYSDSSYWYQWRKFTTATSLSFWSPKLGKSYCFKARARDWAGNVGAFSAERCTIVPYDNNSGMWYSWGWTSKYKLSGLYKGSVRYSTRKGSTTTFKFWGKQIYWVGSKTPQSGKAYIYVDGKYVKTVDLYSKTWAHRKWIFSKGWSKNGMHTVKVVVAGKKNWYSKGYRVDVDGWAVNR